jgi:hypothetical protein
MIEFDTVTPAFHAACSLPAFRIRIVSAALTCYDGDALLIANLENFTPGDESITLSLLETTLASPVTPWKLSACPFLMAGKQRAVAQVATKSLGALMKPFASRFEP